MNKEQIYDEQISPLMAQIIDICKANKIAHVASFWIPTEEDDQLACTTVMLTDEFDPPPHMIEAAKVLRHGRRSVVAPMMLRTENGDGSMTMTAIVG